jgi:hypothetical protein
LNINNLLKRRSTYRITECRSLCLTSNQLTRNTFHVRSTMHIILDPIETSGEAFEVRSLHVHSIRWATKLHPLTASIHCSYAQHLET